jgi:hypothetical protein
MTIGADVPYTWPDAIVDVRPDRALRRSLRIGRADPYDDPRRPRRQPTPTDVERSLLVTMYLPNPELDPTGAEPGEFIDPDAADDPRDRRGSGVDGRNPRRKVPTIHLDPQTRHNITRRVEEFIAGFVEDHRGDRDDVDRRSCRGRSGRRRCARAFVHCLHRRQYPVGGRPRESPTCQDRQPGCHNRRRELCGPSNSAIREPTRSIGSWTSCGWRGRSTAEPSTPKAGPSTAREARASRGCCSRERND